MSYDVRIKQVAPQHFACIRAATLPRDFGQALSLVLEEVWQYLNTLESVTVGPAVARYFRVELDRIEFEAGFPLNAPAPSGGRVVMEQLPGGRAASALHWGVYAQLPEAHAAVQSWIEQEGHVSTGPPYDIYWVDPGTAASPEDIRTEVVWPIA